MPGPTEIIVILVCLALLVVFITLVVLGVCKIINRK